MTPSLKRLGALCCVFILTGIAGAQKVEVPDSAVGKRLKNFVDAFNTGDRAAMRSFIHDNYTASALAQRDEDSRVETYLGLYRQTRGFDLRKIERATGTEIVALAQTRFTHDWWRISIAIDADAGNRVPGLTFRAVPTPDEFTPHVKLSDSEIATQLNDYVSKLADAHLFSGVVLVAKPGGEAIVNRAVGKTTDGAAITPETVFGLASISKVFTAVAVSQLADQGKLSFDDPVSKYIPEYPKPAGDRILVRQLLTHTAGLPALLDARYFQKSHTVGEFIEMFSKLPPEAKPGEFHYSNAGYIVLRAVVAKASGQSFIDYLSQHVFKAAGMSPAGEGSMSAQDLLRFAQTLRSGKLLSPAAWKRMSTGQVTEEEGVRYGFGLEERTLRGERYVGHGGGSTRVSAQFDIYDSGYTVVVMSDRSDAPSAQIAARAADLITQK